MTAEEFTRLLQGVHRTSSGWEAKCPAHEDKHASLSVADGDAVPVVLCCHAGCKPRDIVAATGQTWESVQGKPRSSGLGQPVATYDYCDPAGKLLFQVQRFIPKTFRQRRPDPAGGWINKLDDTPRVPYRLPELVAADPQRTVFVAEGEKDVDRLVALGLVATCNPCGADDGSGNKWHREFADYLHGRRVVLLQDNDEPGAKHVAWIGSTLLGRATSVRIVAWPDKPKGYDVSDYLSNGGSVASLLELAEAAPEWVAATERQPGEDREEQPPAAAGPAAPLPPIIVEYLDAEPPKPVRYVVQNLLPEESCLILGGEPKTGKSFVSLHMALCVLTGRPVLDKWDVLEPGPILVFTPEGAKSSRKRRLWRLALGLDLDPAEVVTKVGFISAPPGHRLDLRDVACVDALRSVVKQVQPRLMILDPLAACAPGVDENSTGEMGEVLAALREATTDTCPSMCLLIVHHVGKMHEGKSLQYSLRGSSVIGGWNDGALALRRSVDEPDGPRRMDVELREGDPPAAFGLRKLDGWHPVGDGSEWQKSWYEYLADPPELHQSRGRGRSSEPSAIIEKILASVAAQPAALDAKAISDLINESPRTTQYNVERLIRSGRLLRGENKKLLCS